MMQNTVSYRIQGKPFGLRLRGRIRLGAAFRNPIKFLDALLERDRMLIE
jgi:hypothetical protein